MAKAETELVQAPDPASIPNRAVAGSVIFEMTVPARGETSFVMKQGQVMRAIDVEGQQVADLMLYRLQDPEERYWVANTIKLNNQVYLTTGHRLYSDRANAMATIVEDTCGTHDTLCGSCSADIDLVRYQVRWHPNCTDNFVRSLARHRLKRRDMVMSFNLFMNAPVQPDGSFAIVEPRSKPGDHIDIRADMDLIVCFSNCPQDLNPCNGFNPTALHVVVYEPVRQAPAERMEERR
jgi:urea carboxylase-associated protein 1